MPLRSLLFLCLLLYSISGSSQVLLSGKVVQRSNGQASPNAKIHLKPHPKHAKTEVDGSFRFQGLAPGTYSITVVLEGFRPLHEKFELKRDTALLFQLDSLSYELDEVRIEAQGSGVSDMEKLKTVEGTAIYEGKKNEVIVLKDMAANLATNNARQVFAKIPGLNIWENDNAGLQLGIGARGLSPNRTSNFNVRQNGYDISADALGYPESYYTPPLEAVERIEIVRGAASLQYGTQFGGLLNFKMKQGGNKPLEVTSRQTIGSYSFWNCFNSIGGKKGKFRYYGFYQHKQGGGFRSYSDFNLNMGHGSVSYSPTEKLTVTAEYTGMRYLTQMPGGLTDKEFEQDPRQVLRNRNWFKVNWNLFALYADYKISPLTSFNTRFFGIYSTRQALGDLDKITVPDDPNANRNLLADLYTNIGNETRLLHRYTLGGQKQVFVVGFRAYLGNTWRRQGDANNGSGPDFFYVQNPNALEKSDYRFPGNNYAAFLEHVFHLTDKLSITPGVRFEYIKTTANGYYTNAVPNGAGTVIFSQKNVETRSRTRDFFLFGLGISHKQSESFEAYANVSQNYRAVTFNDIRVVNPSLIVDPNIHDEKGYTMDIGSRGTFKRILQYDISFYYMYYNGRIGDIYQKEVKPPLYQNYRYHTNVADSRTYGMEAFAELDAWRLFQQSSKLGIPIYGSLALNDARYVNTQDKSILNNYVELVPRILLRLGAGIKYKTFRLSYQYSYVGQQYTDASNATYDNSAIIGLIPTYYVMDLSAKYSYKFIGIEAGINNLGNRMYFTRRADGYPGPGIIPSAGRNGYVTLQFKF